MIVHLALFGYLCLSGYRAIEKKRGSKEGSLLSSDSLKEQIADNEKGFYDKQMLQMYDSAKNDSDGNISTKIAQDNFDAVNNREIKSAAIALALAAATPLSPLFAIASLPFILYASRRVIKESFDLAKKGQFRVETIISTIIIGTLLLGQLFIASFATLLYKLSLKLTSKIIHQSKQQLTETLLQTPESVWILVDGAEVSLPFNDIEIGHIVVVHAGDTVPVDGLIESGMATIDQHILTGESIPVEKTVGDEVFAMTLILSGKLHIKVNCRTSESNAAKITQLLNQTADFKSGVQLQAETLSGKLVNPVIGTSLVAMPLVGFGGALGILACHPGNSLIGIAPITTLKHISAASKQGILIKDGRTLELLKSVDTVVFDKTGTLTDEQPYVGQIHCFTELSQNEVLRLAAAAEFKQTHPLAKAILAAARQRELTWPAPNECEYRLGYGLIVVVDGVTVRLGSRRFMVAERVAIPPELAPLEEQSHTAGTSLVLVAVADQLVAAIELRPSLRPEAKRVITELKRRKTVAQIYIISGDGETATRELAKTLGVDGYFAEILPQNKAAIIQQLQQQGRSVCFVGDGINDAIALKRAQVSVSLAGASKIATDTAQVVLLDRGIEHLTSLFELADHLNKKMDRLFKIMLTPSLMGASSVLFLGTGVTAVLYLCSLGMIASIGYVLLPLPKQLTPPKNRTLPQLD
ncbi:heavy metal translocating P-type ATPase [Ectothiorhodospiraceae bacterium BW-2]|nr:heavy metal translocating P-type ATPase [Ectothiorhodospiraceae bacterium BW-2]